jgi:hypothetical protein
VAQEGEREKEREEDILPTRIVDRGRTGTIGKGRERNVFIWEERIGTIGKGRQRKV